MIIKTKSFFYILFCILTIILGSTAIYFKIKNNQPPVELIKSARENISIAAKNNADQYANNSLNKSKQLYDSAMVYWNIENEKFILFRKYDKVIYWANESIKKASSASQQSVSTESQLGKSISKELKNLESQYSAFKKKFDMLPVSSIWQEYNSGKLKLEQAKASFQAKQLYVAKEKLTESKNILNKCSTDAEKTVSNYFKQYPEWNKSVQNAIAYSKKNACSVIIVDKIARECLLYQSGKLIQRFPVELGKNWMGHKKHSGDNSTPEGHYKVVSKKDNKHTKYYKALLLNYPNESDKEQFKENKKKGLIAKNKTIGGLIEIHGEGGQGLDWTNGCIALTNHDMDQLYAKVSNGTQVVIVGSINNLDAFLR